MITLKGNNNSVLTISLHDIINLIPNISNYKWKIIWIEGYSSTFNILKFEKMINKSQDGVLIDANILIDLSLKLNQLVEIVLIGDKEESDLHKYGNDSIMKEKCDFFIELIDSSYWEISSSNIDFLEEIKKLSYPNIVD